MFANLFLEYVLVLVVLSIEKGFSLVLSTFKHLLCNKMSNCLAEYKEQSKIVRKEQITKITIRCNIIVTTYIRYSMDM